MEETTDLAVYDGEVTSAGRIELLPFVHEQAISITAHRFGNPDDWSAAVIYRGPGAPLPRSGRGRADVKNS